MRLHTAEPAATARPRPEHRRQCCSWPHPAQGCAPADANLSEIWKRGIDSDKVSFSPWSPCRSSWRSTARAPRHWEALPHAPTAALQEMRLLSLVSGFSMGAFRLRGKRRLRLRLLRDSRNEGFGSFRIPAAMSSSALAHWIPRAQALMVEVLVMVLGSSSYSVVQAQAGSPLLGTLIEEFLLTSIVQKNGIGSRTCFIRRRALSRNSWCIIASKRKRDQPQCPPFSQAPMTEDHVTSEPLALW